MKDLEESVDNYFNDLISSPNNWSLSSMIDRFVKTLGTRIAHDYMAKLILAYLTDDFLKAISEDADMMAQGFCRVKQIGKDYKYTIEESIIVEATINYFKSIKFLLSNWYCQHLSTSPDATIAGILMDSLFKRL